MNTRKIASATLGAALAAAVATLPARAADVEAEPAYIPWTFADSAEVLRQTLARVEAEGTTEQAALEQTPAYEPDAVGELGW